MFQKYVCVAQIMKDFGSAQYESVTISIVFTIFTFYSTTQVPLSLETSFKGDLANMAAQKVSDKIIQVMKQIQVSKEQSQFTKQSFVMKGKILNSARDIKFFNQIEVLFVDYSM